MNGRLDHEERIVRLERSLRRTRFGLVVLAAALVSVAAAGWIAVPAGSEERGSQEIPREIRARSVVIVDSAGTPRIVLGAPVPDPRAGKRRSDRTGMVINDPEGHERFGLGLATDGRVSMGFDAPPGVGDQRNRERMNLGVFPSGVASLRMLDNGTRVLWRARIGADGGAWQEFLEWENREVLATYRFGLDEVKRLGDRPARTDGLSRARPR